MVNAVAYSEQQLSLFEECEYARGGGILGSLSGRTCLGHSRATRALILEPCLKKSEKVKFQCLKVIWATAGLVQCPGAEIAWRVLDAQYWGVPQRRKRIFLVADFAADGRCAGEILFEPARGGRNIASCERAREGSSERTESGARIALYDIQHRDDVIRPIKDGNVPTLTARMGTGGHNVPIVLQDGRIYKLTPTECERLQGLPDGYTEGGSDTARYKALGNGMAQPCADYVIRRIIEEVS